MLLPQWGQFVDHDIAFTKSNNTDSMPIAVPKCDTWFDPNCTGKVSLPFSRSLYELDDCARNQLNSKSAWIDASHVYGADK